MRKIISLFKRNYDGDRLVYDEVVPGAEWVLAGEGIATRKHDGTSCLFKDGKLFRRYDAKKGKPPPEGFIPAQEPDPITGHWPGWLMVSQEKNQDQWHREGLENTPPITDGTYELVGPKIQGNAEKFDKHALILHGSEELPDAPRSFSELKEYLKNKDIEGIVWHRENGDRVKIKKKDFGLRRTE